MPGKLQKKKKQLKNYLMHDSFLNNFNEIANLANYMLVFTWKNVLRG